jgi:hypothetical protein
VAGVLLAGSVMAADGPRYTYGEIGYERLDIDNYSGDGDFGNIGGSFALNDRIYMFAAYQDGSVDGSGPDIDVSTFEAGLGVHFPLNDTIDLVGNAAYAWAKVDVDNFGNEDDDGYALSAGLRAMVTPKLELNGGGSYVDISDDDTALYLGAVYSFTDMFAVTTGASFGDDATSYGVGLRLYFDVR